MGAMIIVAIAFAALAAFAVLAVRFGVDSRVDAVDARRHVVSSGIS